ncbi:MAG: glycoside hydrolase family 88 protein [Vicinamibacteria bacterium]|nr:glycoside hydrolase family 88 protein [Vicinamibacteria bacterium]
MQMADSVMARDPSPLTLDSAKPAWNYTQGLVLKAVLAVYGQTGDARQFDYVKAYYDYFVNPDGSIKTYDVNEYSVDRINAGKVLFPLYEKTKEEKYRKAIDLLRLQMKDHPRTREGGFWHKKRYPWQMWLDGLYMASPFLAQYAVTFDEPKLIDDVINQFVWMEKHARDPKTGLLYHGWDESREQKWADPATGLSKEFWGRAVGWYAMALVDVLDFIPKAHPRRGEILAILDRLAAAVVKVQDPKTGVFWQVLDKPGRDGNYLESSASAMFAYAFLKGSRLGYLDRKYAAAGKSIYAGVVKEFVTTDEKGIMSIHKGCSVAGLGGDPNSGTWRSGTFDYYVKEPVRSNDPKAVGPFILASLELDLGTR